MAQVLLIGFGGTGSKIVNQTVADLQRSARRHGTELSFDDGRMAFAVLDTNSNDIKGINKTNTGITNIQICDDKKIREYLNIYKAEGVRRWMPVSRGLLEESITDGCGQMRPKSRLAFRCRRCSQGDRFTIRSYGVLYINYRFRQHPDR